MKRLQKKLWVNFLLPAALLLSLVNWTTPAQAQTPAPPNPVYIFLFWGEGCPHCAQAKPFLNELTQRYANTELRAYEIYYVPENQELFQKMTAAYGFEPHGVPTIFIGDQYWEGQFTPDIWICPSSDPTGASVSPNSFTKIWDSEGKINVDQMLMVADCGRVINPLTAAGQVEGGMAQAMGFALTEEMLIDSDDQPLNTDFKAYHIPRAKEMPATDVIFVQTDEPSRPFGAKSVAEISIDGVARSTMLQALGCEPYLTHQSGLSKPCTID